jgi:hypothetical protein
MVMAPMRIPSLLFALLALGLFAGCGAVFINQGSRNSSYAEGIPNPNQQRKTAVPEEYRVISDFEDGSNNMNPKLYGAGLGFWGTSSSDGNVPNGNFVVAGGANDTKMAAHVFGILFDRGDGRYPTFALEGKFKPSGYYDLSPFQGVKFYYKCPATDRAIRRHFGFGIASTVSTADGGVCRDQCGNDYGANLKPTNDWEEKTFAFADLKQEEGWGDSVNPPDFTDHLKEVIYIKWEHGANNKVGTYNIDYWVDEVEFY